jgi:hypothetical protein
MSRLADFAAAPEFFLEEQDGGAYRLANGSPLDFRCRE